MRLPSITVASLIVTLAVTVAVIAPMLMRREKVRKVESNVLLARHECVPLHTNLEGLKYEVQTLMVRHYRIIEGGGSRENDATRELRGLVDYARSCWGISLDELGITPEFWREIH